MGRAAKIARKIGPRIRWIGIVFQNIAVQLGFL
jgi:hypothetical protein